MEKKVIKSQSDSFKYKSELFNHEINFVYDKKLDEFKDKVYYPEKLADVLWKRYINLKVTYWAKRLRIRLMKTLPK